MAFFRDEEYVRCGDQSVIYDENGVRIWGLGGGREMMMR